MTKLIDLQRRIQAIKATKKVTHAMRLIAVSSYSKMKERHETLVTYRNQLNDTITNLAISAHQLENQFLFATDETNSSPLYIIVSSSRGLCGPFHSNLARHSSEKLRFRRHQKPTFITIGKRALEIVQDSVKNRPKNSFTIVPVSVEYRRNWISPNELISTLRSPSHLRNNPLTLSTSPKLNASDPNAATLNLPLA